MIAYLEGLLAETWGTSCIVVTRGGVGYELDLPAHTMASLPGRGESVALYTSLVVREDAQQLFGFATFEERQVFEVLLTISKVGARTALAILSLYRPDDLRRIVLEEDVDALTRVSGIGKKTAQKLILELKDKLSMEDMIDAAYNDSVAVQNAAGDVRTNVISALTALGYSGVEAGRAVSRVDGSADMDEEQLLKAALRFMI